MMDEVAELVTPIERLVRKAIPGVAPSAQLDSATNLHEAGLTSMAMVKLMLMVEAEFDIEIPDADLSPENFRSIGALEALVARLRAH